jgi:predicted regulator of Ras-like GTPase activity (Roadblock/LC7/MglB family)
MTRKQSDLKSILEDIVTKGDYEAALLSDSDGLTLAAVEAGEFVGLMAAIASLLQDSAQKARQQLDLAHVNELSLVGDDRFRLVCRFFEARDGQSLNLVLIVPPDQAYRRITNRAIKRIQAVWSV